MIARNISIYEKALFRLLFSYSKNDDIFFKIYILMCLCIYVPIYIHVIKIVYLSTSKTCIKQKY